MPQTRPISRGKWRSSYLSFVSRGDLMKWAVVFCLFWASSAAAQGRDLDLVLAGGRVLDPETGLDAERDVGIASGSIAAVYEGSLSSRLKSGGTLIDARGLIVAPGFIDLHAHGQTNRANEFQAHDGVTTALELEGGYGGVGDWIASRKGRGLLNFGASVSHGTLRVHAMPQYAGGGWARFRQAPPVLPRRRSARDLSGVRVRGREGRTHLHPRAVDWRRGHAGGHRRCRRDRGLASHRPRE